MCYNIIIPRCYTPTVMTVLAPGTIVTIYNSLLSWVYTVLHESPTWLEPLYTGYASTIATSILLSLPGAPFLRVLAGGGFRPSTA